MLLELRKRVPQVVAKGPLNVLSGREPLASRLKVLESELGVEALVVWQDGQR
jgi:hypothetical protein